MAHRLRTIFTFAFFALAVAFGSAMLAGIADAAELACSKQGSVRSQNGAPTSVTFVNKSGMYRALNWIDFDGRVTSFGGLNPGESKTLSSFVSHPWMIATGPEAAKMKPMRALAR